MKKSKILTISLALLMISLVRGEVVVDDKNPRQIEDAIIGHMEKRGYELYAQTASAILLVYNWRGNTQGECYDQRWIFKLQDLGSKTSVTGYATCYTKHGVYPFTPEQIDQIIVDALRENQTEFK